MTNEAPLPDDVERCLSEMPNVGGFGEEWSGTIRAHIAAQSEKISALEKKLSEQIREDEMRLINHCIKIIDNNSRSHLHAEAEFLTKIAELEEQINLMSKHQAGVDEKLCVLEAENKRLVDYSRMLVTISIQALERLSINPTTRTSYLIKRLDTAINGMQIVLAQTGEK